ncbi:hypothetical protein BJ742DRAFT_489663 [Cladochytrium replicatum]|nr:hypothetical protein BJ742DRAFT_489663 [Cladochytrium replicatum]
MALQRLGSSPALSSDAPGSSTARPLIVMSLILTTNILTLVLTVIPVVTDLGPIIKPSYYHGDDIIRLLEPLITLPLVLLILVHSNVFSSASPPNRSTVVFALLFAFGAAIYQQGAAFHSAAAMFKHPVADYVKQNPDSPDFEYWNDFYVWIRTTWEHVIAHYAYALGGLTHSMSIAYAYRHASLESKSENDSWGFRIVWTLAVLTYGLTVGLVAIEFPLGSVVALVIIVVYGFGVLGGFAWRAASGFRNALKWGTRYVVVHYVLSFAVALVIVIGWMIHAKGIRNREQLSKST